MNQKKIERHQTREFFWKKERNSKNHNYCNHRMSVPLLLMQIVPICKRYVEYSESRYSDYRSGCDYIQEPV